MIENTLPKSLKILYNCFKTQNVEQGHFDVEFHIGDEILYAHKTILWPVSSIFEKHFFGLWKEANAVIPITNYSFTNFKEFLTYFYVEKCKITNDNVITIVDLSEYYHVDSLKEKCDKFLSKMEVEKLDTILWLEFCKLYSLKLATMHFLDLVRSNITELIHSECFINAKKDTLKAIVSSRWLNVSEEELFDAILKWAKHQLEMRSCNENKGLKFMIKDLIPLIRFPIMRIQYLESNEVFKQLFVPEEFNNILFDAKNFADSNKITFASPYVKSLRCWR